MNQDKVMYILCRTYLQGDMKYPTRSPIALYDTENSAHIDLRRLEQSAQPGETLDIVALKPQFSTRMSCGGTHS